MTARRDEQALRDRVILVAVLEHHAFDDLEFDGGSPREIFDGWLKRLDNNNCSRALSDKQRAWIEGVARRLDIDLGSANLVSSGVVKVKPKEREQLQQFLSTLERPKIPPHRRCLRIFDSEFEAGLRCTLERGHRGDCS